jgi:hypothetical protein
MAGDRDLANTIMKEFLARINRRIASRHSNIQSRIRARISELLRESNVYKNFEGPFGLGVQFGVRDGRSVLDKIISVVSDGLQIKISPFRYQGGVGEVSGEITFSILKSDYQAIYAVPGAEYYSINRRRGTRYKVEWAKWLMEAGDSLVVIDHHVVFGAFSQSRTGGAIMIPKGYFQIPIGYRGLPGRNYITRALAPTIGPDITGILREEIGT